MKRYSESMSKLLTRALFAVILIFPICAYAGDTRTEIYYLEDAAGTKTFENILDSADFKPAITQPLNFGFTKSVVWIKFRPLKPPNTFPLYLVDRYEHAHSYKLFLPKDNYFYPLDFKKENADVGIYLKSPTFLLQESMGNSYFYARIESGGKWLLIDLHALSTSEFINEVFLSQSFYGLFFGSLIVLMLYNLFLYASLKETPYLHYVLYLFSISLMFLHIDGFTNLVQADDAIRHVFPGFMFLTLFYVIKFSGSFLNIRQVAPRFHRVFRVLEVLVAIIFLSAISFLPEGISVATASIVAATTVPFVVFTAFKVQKSNPSVKIFLVGWLGIGVMTLIYAAQPWQLIEMSPTLNKHGLKVATVFEAIVFAIALAYRTKMLEIDKKSISSESLRKTKYAADLSNALENERRMISQELHDNFNAAVAAIKLMASNIVNITADDDVRERAQKIEEIATSAYNSARKFVKQLRPELLYSLGLEYGVNDLVDEYRKIFLNCTINLRYDVKSTNLPNVLNITIYRILKEAITNTMKHSKATELSLSITERGSIVYLSIIDNGVGFNKNFEEGIGITSMRERCSSLGGKFNINGNKGTEIRIELPIVYE